MLLGALKLHRFRTSSLCFPLVQSDQAETRLLELCWAEKLEARATEFLLAVYPVHQPVSYQALISH